MRHTSGKVLSVVLFIIAIQWCVVLLLFRWPLVWTFHYCGGLVGGALSLFIAAIVSLCISGHGKDTTEIDVLPDIATVCYALFGIVFNGAFVWFMYGHLEAVLVVGNVMALLIYGVVLFALSGYATRVDRTAAGISAGVSQYARIRDLLPALLVQTQDADIRKALLALKSTIESGNNMAQAATHEEEVTLFEQLYDLQQLMQGGAEKDIILQKVAEARQTAMLRNAGLH